MLINKQEIAGKPGKSCCSRVPQFTKPRKKDMAAIYFDAGLLPIITSTVLELVRVQLSRKLRHVSWKETDSNIGYRRTQMKHWVRVLIILFACLFPAFVECRVRHYKFNVSISMKYSFSCCGWVWRLIGAWLINVGGSIELEIEWKIDLFDEYRLHDFQNGYP